MRQQEPAKPDLTVSNDTVPPQAANSKQGECAGTHEGIGYSIDKTCLLEQLQVGRGLPVVAAEMTGEHMRLVHLSSSEEFVQHSTYFRSMPCLELQLFGLQSHVLIDQDAAAALVQ